MFESDNSARSSLTKPRNSVLLMPEITGTKCTKVGTFRTAKKVKYQCQKSSKGLRWAMTSSKNTANTSMPNTSSTTTTTLAPIYLDSEITDVSKLLAAQECQIKDATFNTSDGSGTRSSGFPRPAQFPSATGQLRVLVVPVNFNDLFFSSVDARSIEATYAKANSYFVAQSGGRASVSVTVAPSAAWVDLGTTIEGSGFTNPPQPQWDGSTFYRKVVDQYLQKNSASGYDVLAVMSAPSNRFYSAQAHPAGATTYATGKNFTGMLIVGGSVPYWNVLAHEIGHAWLGYEDLYLFRSQNESPLGKWDLMSQTGTELSGWSRFLASWIEASAVRCASPTATSRHYLTALNSESANTRPRLLVVPLSASSAIVADYRAPNTWSPDLKTATLVVYRVDTTVDHGNGPITLVGLIDQVGGTLSSGPIKISTKAMNAAGVVLEVGK
jgi:M6 family metalloprotease-like protein